MACNTALCNISDIPDITLVQLFIPVSSHGKDAIRDDPGQYHIHLQRSAQSERDKRQKGNDRWRAPNLITLYAQSRYLCNLCSLQDSSNGQGQKPIPLLRAGQSHCCSIDR